MVHKLNAERHAIRVRPLEHNDIENLRVWRNDKENSKYLAAIEYITPEMQEIWFRNYLTDKSIYTLAIDETKDIKGMVGSISFYNFQENSFEIGRILIGEPLARGKGIGKASVSLCVELAFANFEQKEIILHVYEDNIPAVKTYERCGFKKIAERKVNGKNEIIMSKKKDNT